MRSVMIPPGSPAAANAARLVAAGLAFAITPTALRMAPAPGALVLVGLAIALAVACSGTAHPLAIAAGALGGFASATLAPWSPAAAGAALVGLAYAERTRRVRAPVARVVHVVAALATGALAFVLTASYTDDDNFVRGVALVVASVLAAVPVLIDADDAVAYALDSRARGLPEGSRSRAALREGADLRRTSVDALLDRETTRGVRKTWAALVRLADARDRLERAGTSAPSRAHALTRDAATHPVIALVDERIRDHVAALALAYSAVDAARAARVGLDDAALRNVTSTGQSFEAESLAILDVSHESAGSAASDAPAASGVCHAAAARCESPLREAAGGALA